MSLNDTPNANRIQIGFFGKRNSGKSSLINAFTGQNVVITSDVAGTTTDPVNKAMEIHGIGACLLIDTAGYDDEGELGRLRVEKTSLAAQKTDIAVLLFSGRDIEHEKKWFEEFKKNNVKVLCVISRTDVLGSEEVDEIRSIIKDKLNQEAVCVNINDADSIKKFKEELIRMVPEDFGAESITGKYVEDGDLVMLVMPQDIQAPKGRLILPQVQTIRDLLDKKCLVMSVTTDKVEAALKSLVRPPKLIITDSQVFGQVYKLKPKESMLTSFSVLFAEYKGDIEYYVKSVKAVENLTEASKVLIAECCTHAPLTEDIGREKIPGFLRKKIGQGLDIEIVSGTDFPEDLTKYDLVIQCGACMFNKKYVLTRINRAKSQGVPMTNYGVVLAHLNGILDKISHSF